MYYRTSHRPLPTGYSPAADPTPQPTSLPVLDADIGKDDPSLPRRRIAIPAPSSTPRFEGVFSLAVTSALLGQTVLVICMTEQVLTDWEQRLRMRPRPIERLELVDGRRAWSAEWRALLCKRHHDVTVLHGVRSALQDQSLPVSHAKLLVSALPAELIVLA
jgi:hypothetical protein